MIGVALLLCAIAPLGVELIEAFNAVVATSINLRGSASSRAPFRLAKATIKLYTSLGLAKATIRLYTPLNLRASVPTIIHVRDNMTYELGALDALTRQPDLKAFCSTYACSTELQGVATKYGSGDQLTLLINTTRFSSMTRKVLPMAPAARSIQLERHQVSTPSSESVRVQ